MAKKKSSKQKKVWVERSSIIKLFRELGYSEKVIAKWDDRKLLEKICNLPTLTDGVKIKNKKAKTFLSNLMKIPVSCLGFKKGGEPQPVQGKEKPAKAKKGKAAKASPTNPSLTRPEAVVKVLKGTRKNISLEDVAAGANELIIKNGGESNLKESAWHVKKVTTALRLWGILNIEGGVVKRAS